MLIKWWMPLLYAIIHLLYSLLWTTDSGLLSNACSGNRAAGRLLLFDQRTPFDSPFGVPLLLLWISICG